ncbi:MAG: hypothetical protein ACI8T1_001489 [Verrucomicrobiales bacterium]|jgi:hypothetical protein
MILTPSEGAMKLLLGEQFPRSGCSSTKECLCRGRELLRRITGEDFLYDARLWRDHLTKTDDDGYTQNGYIFEFERRITELESDDEWNEARDELEKLPDPPSSPPNMLAILKPSAMKRKPVIAAIVIGLLSAIAYIGLSARLAG